MSRGFAAIVVAVAVLTTTTPIARADAIDDRVEELESGTGYKLRIAAALSLSKTSDDRAVDALAAALRTDKEASVRKVAALALKKIVTGSTRKKSRVAALDALEYARDKDKDKKVRKAAKKALAALEALLATRTPRVFVNIPASKDKTKKAPSRAISELDKAVRGEIARASTDYAVDWPGELPTSSELEQFGTQGFIVAAAVSKLTIDKAGGRAEVVCTVEIRVAPWDGSDGEERWVANQTGKATGSGKATTGSSEKQIAGGVVDCVGAVGEQLTSDKIVPFIKRLESSR